ncbi:MAG: hypothetical protein GY944_11030 [bacterium]|nr:hypothetical protein [bacterium]MCP5041549.1 hypothetical protein [bacterium]
MMHPLLSPRLFAQSDRRPLAPLRPSEPRPVRDFLLRTGGRFYHRFGPALGFLLGLALALWTLLPETVR